METNDKRQNGDWGTGMKARLSAILICCVSLLPYAASAEAGDGNQGGLLIGDFGGADLATEQNTAGNIQIAGKGLDVEPAPVSTISRDEIEALPAGRGIYRLGAIVVPGNANVTSPGQSQSIVDQDTIRAMDARTLDEGLQQLPGVDVRLRKQGSPRVQIRGLPPREVPLFLNGIPINSASDGQFDPRLIPTENIALIQVTRGTSSVLYGPGALGGVIDIITKKGAGDPTGSLGTEFGQGNERLVRGSAGAAQGEYDGFISGSYYDTDGYPVADGGLRQNSDQLRKNLFLNGGYTPGDQWSFGANFGYVDGDFGIPVSTVNNNANIFASRPKYERIEDIGGKQGQVDVRYAHSKVLDFRLSGYINLLDQQDNIYDNGNFDSMSNRRVKSQSINQHSVVSGGQLQTVLDLESPGIFTLALLGKNELSKNTGMIRDVPAGGGNFDFRSVDERKAVQTYSTALQYSVMPFPRTRLVTGVAEHWFVQDDGVTCDWQAMMSAFHDLTDYLRLNAAISRGPRFPSIDQLFDINQGNPDLKPEIGFNAQGGFTLFLPDDNTIDVTGFRNDVKNFIQKDDVSDINVNNDTLFLGGEIGWTTFPIEGLSVRTAYSYLDATVDQSTADDLQFDLRPRHKIDFQGIYNFDHGWQAFLSTSYLAGQVVTSRTLPVQQESLQNYAEVNVKLQRSFLDDALSVYVGADNLFNANPTIGPGFPLPGRFVFGGISARL